jgi:flagellar assembly protein FliH
VIAEQLVRREISRDQTVIGKLVEEGLEALPVAGSAVRIVVNPDDASFMSEHMEGRPDLNYEIKADAAISRGGCRLETDVSSIDATLETRLGRLIEAMLDAEANQDADT